MRRVEFLLALLGALLITFHDVRAQADQPLILTLKADMVVGPAMRNYVRRGIQTAEQRHAEALIIQLDTPGGELGVMQGIMESIRASTVPVVVYVAPNGASAGSAGALITMSAQVAAMAPEAAIGASSPVGGSGEELDPTLKTKVVEDMKALVRPLVERRGPAATQLAQDMIEKAKAVTAKEALQVHLIDFIAVDMNDVIGQLDGRSVALANGRRTIDTAGAVTESIELTPIEELLRLLNDANLVFILLTLGVLALQVELTHPGVWVPGFVGVVCIALAIYGMGLLPVNWFGLTFIATSFVLFILDIKAPTHGTLTVAGVATFILGALMLFNTPSAPRFERVSVPLVVGVGISLGLMFAFVLAYAWRSQREPVRSGAAGLIGMHGTARSEVGSGGQVQVGAELWSAEAAQDSPAIGKGDRIEVVEVRGLRLRVRKI